MPKMDINSTASIKKLSIKGQIIYVRYIWEDNGNNLFHLKLYDGKNCWTGSFSSDFANKIDEPIEEYRKNVKRGLSDVSSEYNFEFTIVPEQSNKAIFSWIKVFEDCTEMPYGSVDLQLDNVTEPMNSLIDFLLNENRELRDIIDIYNRRNTTLTENLDVCKHELEEFVNMKTSLESNLYGKFVQLLNQKKKRIQLLEEHIQKFE